MAVGIWARAFEAARALPVSGRCTDVVDAVSAHGTALLVAPPGTGKTTLVPLALAAARDGGRVVVAQPRRIAARAAAARMAALTATELGDLVGYTVRDERRVGPATRVEVVTTGVLLQRLLRDPDLPGVAAVVLDECHERHLDADLALAFTVDVRAGLRDDLWLLAMSATPDVPTISAALAPAAATGDVPLVHVAAATHPVDVRHAPPPAPPRPPGPGNRVDPALLDHVAGVCADAWRGGDGDVLAFLPGRREIEHVADEVRRMLPPAAVVATLHGGMGSGEQDAVLRPGDAGRRVVVASAVAESSLTVPGVRTVVDAGLARIARHDPARGLDRLVTLPVSRASADQRAGRAGREGPGTAYRCWPATDHHRLPEQPEAEIAVGDLTPAALALAAWGCPDGRGLSLPDPPPAGPFAAAAALLRGLGATDERGVITPHGRALARIGAHPRLAHALLVGAALVGGRQAAEVIAALDDEVSSSRGLRDEPDLARRIRALRDGTGGTSSARQRWQAEARRLHRGLTQPQPGPDGAPRVDPVEAVGPVAALAYPDRIARRRDDGDTYVLTGGSSARLPAGSAHAGSAWIVVVDAVPPRPGATAMTARVVASVDEASAASAGRHLLEDRLEVTWSDGDVRARRVRRLGVVVLSDTPATQVPDRLRADAVRDGLRREGLALLRWTPPATSLRQRLAACHRWRPQEWPDVGDDALVGDTGWLQPGLDRCRARRDLERLDVLAALRALVPWQAAAAGGLDALAPERVAVPSGRLVALDWSDPDRPVLPVKLQECFGWGQGPRVLGGEVAVVLHLLSPAGRPLAVTADLESFWAQGYPQVRAQMRGRYPKHPWPEDPWAAPPTARTAGALRRDGR